MLGDRPLSVAFLPFACNLAIRQKITHCGHSQSIQLTAVRSILVGGLTTRRYEDD